MTKARLDDDDDDDDEADSDPGFTKRDEDGISQSSFEDEEDEETANDEGSAQDQATQEAPKPPRKKLTPEELKEKHNLVILMRVLTETDCRGRALKYDFERQKIYRKFVSSVRALSIFS